MSPHIPISICTSVSNDTLQNSSYHIRLVNKMKSDEDLELQKKEITTDNIIHVSSVEFHEEFNGITSGAEKVGKKKRT